MNLDKDKVASAISGMDSATKVKFRDYLKTISENDKWIDTLDELTDDEYDVFLKVLEDSVVGDTDSIVSLYAEDYDEIPVDIVTFISDPEYLGGSTNNGEGIYPYWMDVLTQIFAPGSNIYEVILTGCLTENEKVRTLDGRDVSIRDIVENFDNEDYYVYSFDQTNHKYTVGKVSEVFNNGVKDVYSITLSNGEVIEATSNHQFLSRDNRWISIDKGLEVGSSLMPMSTEVDRRGYEWITHPSRGVGSTQELTHRMTMRWKMGDDYVGTCHHKDFEKLNNDPRNLTLFPDQKSHWKWHANNGGLQFEEYNELVRQEGTPERESMLENTKRASGIRWSDDSQRELAAQKFVEMNKNPEMITKQVESKRLSGVYDRQSEEMTEYNKYHHPHLVKVPKEDLIESLSSQYNYLNSAGELGISATALHNLLSKYEVDPEDYVKESPIKFPHRFFGPLFRVYNLVYHEYGEVTDDTFREYSDKAGISHEGNDVTIVTYGYMVRAFPSTTVRNHFEGDWDEFLKVVVGYNHKVVSIEYLGKRLTYDIEVEGHHNFVLSSGVVAHNSIGTGKSTIAVMGMLYSLYKVLCLKNPAEYYELTGGSKIALALFNMTLDAVYGIAWDKMQGYVKRSPWFLRNGSLSGRNAGAATKMIESGEIPSMEILSDLTWSPGKDTEIKSGSKPSNFTGFDIISSFLDEMNFYEKGGSGNAVTDYKSLMSTPIMKVYSAIMRRMESRFMVRGVIPGVIFLVSSKKSEMSPLELYVDTRKGARGVLVVDEPLWVIKWSEERYSGRFFNLLVGDIYTPTRVLSSDEDVDELRASGRRVIRVPVEHREAFESSPDEALTDIAGIALVSGSRYMDPDNVVKSFTTKNSFIVNEIVSGTRTSDQLYDWIDLTYFLEYYNGEPMYFHIDASKSNDATGIAGAVRLDGTVDVARYDKGEVDVTTIKDYKYIVPMAVAVKAPSGDQIPFKKVLTLLLHLRNVGLNIQGITMDTYQSTYLLQEFVSNGFSASELSLDRNSTGYDYLKNSIDEGRVELPTNQILQDELVALKKDSLTNKVDHPASGGRKDISDAVAGSVFSAFNDSVLKGRGAKLGVAGSAQLDLILGDDYYNRVRSESSDKAHSMGIRSGDIWNSIYDEFEDFYDDDEEY